MRVDYLLFDQPPCLTTLACLLMVQSVLLAYHLLNDKLKPLLECSKTQLPLYARFSIMKCHSLLIYILHLNMSQVYLKPDLTFDDFR